MQKGSLEIEKFRSFSEQIYLAVVEAHYSHVVFYLNFSLFTLNCRLIHMSVICSLEHLLISSIFFRVRFI